MDGVGEELGECKSFIGVVVEVGGLWCIEIGEDGFVEVEVGLVYDEVIDGEEEWSGGEYWGEVEEGDEVDVKEGKLRYL